MLDRISLGQPLVEVAPVTENVKSQGPTPTQQRSRTPAQAQRFNGTVSKRVEEERRGHHRSRPGADRGQE